MLSYSGILSGGLGGTYTNPRLPPYPVVEAGGLERVGGDLMGAYTNPRLPPYPVAEAGV